MKAKNKSFTTSFGDEILYVEGYRDLFKGFDKQFSTPEHYERKNRVPSVQSPGGFIPRFYRLAILLDFMASLGSDLNFGKVLDIGAGAAVQLRLLKGAGLADQADAIDLRDGTGDISDQQIKALWQKIQNQMMLKKMFPFFLERQRAPTNRGLYFGSENETYGYYIDSLYRIGLNKVSSDLVLDNYYVQDINLLNQTYDTLFSFNAIDYFELDEIFENASRLLKENGTFAFIVNYWWYPVNATTIIGHFPYAIQRLCKDDFFGYLEQWDLNETEFNAVRERYEYFSSSHPTVAGYCTAAQKHGFMNVGYRRLGSVELQNNRAIVSPSMLNRYNNTSLDEVLKNLHRFNSKVFFEDLNTSHVMMVFQKQPKASGFLGPHELSQIKKR
jgi:SAM-dependent methyltransferase